ncbi:MAG: ABC transporter ATP-binding protein [Myxococcales bacterium]|nr:ABC transporter ATP-binding protein [Myxococcales bacterium]
MATDVVLEHLSRRFAGSERPAVDDVSLTVEAGEVVSLVGPSGCGKSTTLRMVAGLDFPDSGRVSIGGKDMTRVPPQARDVAMVFQGFALYPHMRVREIMAFPLKMRGVRAAEREATVQKTADLLGIGGLLERRPGQLSGGEQQRVAMGRAIVRKPAVFLFDEPLSNLDAALRAELRVELGKLLRRLEATALYVTHDQAEAMTLSSRIAVVRAGRLEQVDTPRRIYEAPATAFVAGFFGAPPMNLIDATRTGERLRAGAFELAAPADAPAKLILGIRPEHIRVGVEAEALTMRAPGKISLSEPHGSETHLEVLSESVALRVKVSGFEAPAVGSSVTIGFDRKHVHWFDRETGKAT